MKKLVLNKNWKLENSRDGKTILADVPGDITYQLYQAGEIANPYFGMNYKDLEWIVRENFNYSTEMYISAEQLNSQRLVLCFYGIDTFSEIYFNGELIGKTENMFLKYEFSIKKYAKLGANTLKVCMLSTLNKMDTIDCAGYFATFNLPRIFIRKAQCHFGWDWAPNLPGYGIWQDVCLEWGDTVRLESVKYETSNDGNVIFKVESTHFTDGDYKLVVKLACEPFEDYEKGMKITVPLHGGKQFVCLKVSDCKLWWPTGYGDANLYPFSVEIESDNVAIDSYRSNCAFRKISIEQKPIGSENLSFIFKVNDVNIYIMGSNWVPIECFTGIVKDEKYERLIKLAKNANFNMLRVWGGGIYEKDIFYDICDREGMLVWQDFMFACADIPEDNADFVKNALAECEYQVKRLINHPCIIYWCGGNEKTGTYGRYVCRGDYFCDNILHGLVKTLDNTRPYIRQSPFSHTDVGNDLTSGESHCNSCEDCLQYGIGMYRKFVASKTPSFVSECAIMGPPTLEGLKKMFPKDKIWPINEYWNDRFMDNPYASVALPFAEREYKFAADLYGEIDGVEDFVCKAMNVHAELMQAEIDYARSRKWNCAGFLNWMYSDIWPSGTWAVVDYFLQPKQVYYRMKQCFEPLRPAFVFNKKGVIELCVFCDGNAHFDGKLVYGERDIHGKNYWQKAVDIQVANAENKFICEVACDSGHYLYAILSDEGEVSKTLYSPTMWGNLTFERDFDVKFQQISSYEVNVIIEAKSFIKSAYIHLDDNYNYTFSDNFVDVEAGGVKIVTIKSKNVIDVDKIQIDSFANKHCREIKESENGR